MPKLSDANVRDDIRGAVPPVPVGVGMRDYDLVDRAIDDPTSRLLRTAG